LCLSTQELDALRDSLLMSINMLPDNAQIALITFGTNVQIYELGYSDCTKAYVFSGQKEITLQMVQNQLGLRRATVAAATAAAASGASGVPGAGMMPGQPSSVPPPGMMPGPGGGSAPMGMAGPGGAQTIGQAP